MFEQSILATDNVAHKTRALAASFGVQTLVVAVAILIPLLIGDRMPAVQLWTKLAAPLPHAPEPVQVQTTASAQSTTSILRNPVRTWIDPGLSRSVAVPVGATVINDVGLTAPGAGIFEGVPGGLLPAMSTLVVEPPAKRVPTTIDKQVDVPRVVGGEVQASKLIRKIVPAYPPIARQARVSGTVRLTSVIAKDGSVSQLQVVSGNPLLVPAALAAVKQWLYSPTLLNGQPVEVIAPIDVIFTLNQ